MRPLAIRSVSISGRKHPGCGEDSGELETRMICLLELFAPGEGMAQRRAIEVDLGEGSVWREFEIVRSFVSSDEAIAYASEHGIVDVEV